MWGRRSSAPRRKLARTSVAIVVPCFNEESTLPLLRAALDRLRSALRETYDIEMLFVDDGSTDGTRRGLEELAHDLKGRVLGLAENAGIAEAFRTGFREARSDLICTIDADCTFDPMQLVPMLVTLEQSGADIVTASPYHPLGRVEGVPAWRLLLSRGASSAYRRLLGGKLYSYTACFRVFRHSALAHLEFHNPRFLGVTQMLVSALDAGLVVVEHPLTLTSRKTGISKMSTLRTARDHAGFMGRLLLRRIAGRSHGARRREEEARTLT
jgi:dolichol-phosphate mannosyltransferase